MKQYRVSRVTVIEPYGSDMSALTTCVREFDTKEEALACVHSMKDQFPEAFIADTGTLVRNIEFIRRKYFKNIDASVDMIIQTGSVFWMILEHGDGLPMPIRLN